MCAFEDRSVCDQDLSAAVGEDAAHFGEGELRVQRNRNASGADDGEEPMKALPVVAAIDGDGLARPQTDAVTQKGIHSADFGVQFRETKGPVLADGDFAIPLATNQLVHKIGNRDAAVARESVAVQKAHSAATGLRPHSLATQ